MTDVKKMTEFGSQEVLDLVSYAFQALSQACGKFLELWFLRWGWKISEPNHGNDF